MAQSWVRLWAGATTDPKFQTIARKSGQPRYLVIALFTHLLLEANEADDRGSLDEVDIEDVASALDCDEEAVEAILQAMEGRVIEGGRLSGWDKRQPIREDSGSEKTGALSSTERSRLHRERKRHATQGNACNGDATQGNAPEAEADADADADSCVVAAKPTVTRKGLVCRMLREQCGVADAAPHHLTDEVWARILTQRTDEEIREFALAKVADRPGQRTGLKYLAPGLLDPPATLAMIPRARGGPPGSKSQALAEHNRRACEQAEAEILAREAARRPDPDAT